jgi:predicted transcriptional regulator
MQPAFRLGDQKPKGINFMKPSQTSTGQQKLQGEFTHDSFPALLQYFGMMGSSGTLLLRVASGPISSISFLEGRIIDARTGSLSGRTAFFELMGLHSGLFQFRSGQLEPHATIDSSLDQLLLEATRQPQAALEINWPPVKQTLSDPVLEPDSVLILNVAHQVEQVQLDNLQLQVLLQAQQQRRAAQIATHLGLSFADARKAIIDLWRLGLIEVRAPQRQPLGGAFITEFIAVLSTVLGPVAKLVAEDAASDLGSSLESLEASQLLAFKNAIETQVDSSRLAKFQALIEPLIKRYQG